MSDAITGPSGGAPLEPSAPKSVNVPLLCKEMQSSVLGLANQLRQVQEDPKLAEHTPFLQGFHETAMALNKTVEQALTMR